MKYCLTIFCSLLFAAPLWAQQAGLTQEVGDLEVRQQRYDAHQQRLETRLAELNRRVQKLKAQPPGVGRDLQLQTALRDSHSVAKRLTDLHLKTRNNTSRLVQLYDRGIANSQDEKEKKRFIDARTKLRNRAAPNSLKIATTGKRNPLDGADDLQEKADLLADSEDKVRGQLKNIKLAIARIEKRLKLQRHSRSMTDNPFVETSPRRSRATARAQPGPASPQAAASSADPKQPGGGTTADNGKTHDGDSPEANEAFNSPPSPSAEGTDLTSGEGSKTGATPDDNNLGGYSDPTRTEPAPTGVSPSVNISNKSVLDAAMLRDLRSGKFSGNTLAQLKALKNAQGQLKKLANRLASQAKDLRKQAKSVKK
jgi:hypothetical protein